MPQRMSLVSGSDNVKKLQSGADANMMIKIQVAGRQMDDCSTYFNNE